MKKYEIEEKPKLNENKWEEEDEFDTRTIDFRTRNNPKKYVMN